MSSVLLLDDDVAFGALVHYVVRHMGHEVVACPSPQSANKAITGTDPSFAAVLLDSSFADSDDDKALAGILTALSSAKVCPPLLLLAASWREPTDPALLAPFGVTRVLQKPVDIVDLERAIAEVLGQRPGALAEADPVPVDELKAKYRRELEATAATLERAIATDGASAQKPLRRLAGTAGSYGYHALSAQARLALGHIGADPEELSESLTELSWIVGAALSSTAPALTRPGQTLGPVRWPATVLVVSADAETVTRVGTELAAQGIELRFAQAVEDAIELAEHYHPDLIVADARLPDDRIDDFPIDEELREGFARAIPMVLLGAPEEKAERIRAAMAGTTVFVDEEGDGAVLAAARALAPESFLGSHIVAVDDDPDITDLVQALLAPYGVQVHVAHEPAELWAALDEVRPALILLDITLPRFDGHALCRTLKAHPTFRDISVVYLTSDGRPQTKVIAFQNGADDFMVKPVIGQELVAKVLGKLRHQQLALRQTLTDPLTGALTQRGIEQRLAALLSRSSRPAGCGLMLFCAPDLGEMEEEAGLLTAERGLREAASALEGAVLGRDAIGRWDGGDSSAHFAVLLMGGAPMAFTSAFERAKRHLAEHPIFGPDGYFRQMHLSAGATVLRERDSVEGALGRAMRALTEANARGKTIVVDG